MGLIVYLYEILTTACSCTGAPTLALEELVGGSNFRELAAAEIHVPCSFHLFRARQQGVGIAYGPWLRKSAEAPTRRWLLQNTQPEKCYIDMRGMRLLAL